MTDYAIGVDLGGTKILSALVDDKGELLERIWQKTDAEQGPANVLDRMADSIRKLLQNTDLSGHQVKGVAVACPGPLDFKQGVIYDSPNLGWNEVRIKEELENRLGLPVWVDKDTNMAARGEFYFGRNRGCPNFIYITVSTGVGGSLLLNGEVYHGYRGGAGEVGHMIAEPGGPLCGCGRRGCLEAVASGTAIARDAKELIDRGQGRGILAYCGKKGPTAKEVGTAARQGDLEACKILDHARLVLGQSISSLIHILNPERVILGGSVALGLEDLWLKPLQEMIARDIFPMHSKDLSIEITDLGGDIGVLGSAAYVFKQNIIL